MVDATTPEALRQVDTTHVALSYHLGAVGMPSVTAWYGLDKLHTDAASLSSALKKVCPDGIDGYFENVGGMLPGAASPESPEDSRLECL